MWSIISLTKTFLWKSMDSLKLFNILSGFLSTLHWITPSFLENVGLEWGTLSLQLRQLSNSLSKIFSSIFKSDLDNFGEIFGFYSIGLGDAGVEAENIWRSWLF